MSEIKNAVCRLCFSTILEDFDYMNLIQQDMVEIILPEMDLRIVQNPVICKECDDVLKQFFKYKSFCLEIEDSIHNYTSDGQLQVDLEKISGMDEMDNANRSKMCRTCLEIIESDSCTHLISEENNLVRIMVQKCLKELDIELTKQPVICDQCKYVLEKFDNFITLSMENEAKIINYLEHYQEKQVDLFNVQILFPEGTFGNKNKKYDTQSQPMKNLSNAKSEKDPHTSDFLEHSHSETAQKNKCTDGCKNVIASPSEVQKFESITNGTSTFNNESENILINENNVSSQLINNGGISSQGNIESSLKDSSNEVKPVTERTITDEILLISDDEDTIVVDKEIANENGYRKHNKRTCTFNKGKSVTHIQDDHMTDSDDTSNNPVIKTEGGDTDSVNEKLPERYTIINNSRCIIEIEDDDHDPLENDTSTKSRNCKTEQDVEDEEKVYVEWKGNQMPESNYSKLSETSDRQSGLQTPPPTEDLQFEGITPVSEIFKCTNCCFEAKESRALDVHFSVCKDKINSPFLKGNQIVQYECSYCSLHALAKQPLTFHLSKHLNLKSNIYYRCTYCFKQSNIREDVECHKGSDIAITYKCEECTFQYTRMAKMAIHAAKHKNIKINTNFCCKICFDKFEKKGDLITHLSCHSFPDKIKIFICSKCPYRSKGKNEVQGHMRNAHKLKKTGPTHHKLQEKGMALKQFPKWKVREKDIIKKCPECEIFFKLPRFKIHMNKYHYACELCPHKTIHPLKMKQHERLHKYAITNKVERCEICFYICKRIKSLKKHQIDHKNSLINIEM